MPSSCQRGEGRISKGEKSLHAFLDTHRKCHEAAIKRKLIATSVYFTLSLLETSVVDVFKS